MLTLGNPTTNTIRQQKLEVRVKNLEIELEKLSKKIEQLESNHRNMKEVINYSTYTD
jgi:predicted RNase H-like nuclease (RuvC/YqgF family)